MNVRTQPETVPSPPRVGACHAFTVADLICTTGALALLAIVSLAGTADQRESARAAVCLSNQRALGSGWKLHALDNNGRLVGNLDGGDVSTGGNSNNTWVLGWLDQSGGQAISGVAGGRANTNSLVLTEYSPLAPYLGRSAAVFKCPADSSLSLGTRGAPRVRSVSMNGYLGRRPGPWTAGYRQSFTLDGMLDPSPAETFVFIEEREDSINDGRLILDMRGFDPVAPEAHVIVDYPADWHDRGLYLSFADGHAEQWKWQDPRTMPRHRRGIPLALGQASPRNPDVARLQAAATRRVPSPP